MKLDMKNRSQRHDINRNRPTIYRHKYTKYKICLIIMMTLCIKGNAQFIFLCNPQKSSVNVCLMKILKITATKK